MMIGVLSKDHDALIVSEFFELFKTPWEYYDPTHRYDVVLASGESLPETDASLVVIYSAKKMPSDNGDIFEQSSSNAGTFVHWANLKLPIYGKSIAFRTHDGIPVLRNENGITLGYEKRSGQQRVLRIGYDLFDEVYFLLTKGQPPENALFPTLDHHIAMLRRFIVETGVPLVEIPPFPAGHKFIACLTHDVDFISLRHHLVDHSFLGFLYRATLGSTINFVKKKIPFSTLAENLLAVLALPFIFTRGYKDPWNQFDHYMEIEQGKPSTFFFIPFKNRPGEGFHGKKQTHRAAKYDVDDVKDTIRMLLSHGCEAGVHGIDAWHSTEKAREERDRIAQAATSERIGIRMHWLCMNDKTFRVLEQAGYDYDSSVGFNDAVGFRAGTAQVYKPIGVERLLELPMHVQDSALFNPGRMNLTKSHSQELCNQILGHCAGQEGGVFTLLWHQRSIGSERLWGPFYSFLIRRLHDENGWFATAQDCVDWFRMRRSARFVANNTVDIPYRPDKFKSFPKLLLRTYENHAVVHDSAQKKTTFLDKPIDWPDQ